MGINKRFSILREIHTIKETNSKYIKAVSR